MKMLNKISVIAILSVSATLGLAGVTRAATATVDLGTATPFAILAYTDITDAGSASLVTGNVGLSPTTGASIGLLSSQVTGTIYTVGPAGPSGSVENPGLLTTAKTDLTTAYTDAANRTPTTLIDSELGGQTLVSGVYRSADTKFGITAGEGPLVLDGQNDPTSVFIFEGSFDATPALTVGPGSIVELRNMASACNVFWRVVAATIDTTAVFKGNILASTSITVNDGANIEGRLLAQTGQVTLINDVIKVPVCLASVAATSTPTPTPTIAATSTPAPAITPKLPKTGITPDKRSISWNIIPLAGILLLVSASVAVAIRKRTV